MHIHFHARGRAKVLGHDGLVKNELRHTGFTAPEPVNAQGKTGEDPQAKT